MFAANHERGNGRRMKPVVVQPESAPSAERSAPLKKSQREVKSSSQQQTRATKTVNTSRDLTKRLASETKQIIELRSRKLTLCLFLLVGAISSLIPFLSLHLTNRVGLLLFEADLIQLRSSLVTVIITFIFLLLMDAIILALDYRFSLGGARQNIGASSLRVASPPPLLTFQRVLKVSVGLLAILSILSYLALALIVPHITQIQRAPLATFDCSANLITIENCHQQFASLNQEFDREETSYGAEEDGQSWMILDTIEQLIVGDLNGNNERLAKRLECLKYNNHHFNNDGGRPSNRGGVPTRFLLHKCGLVCEPHRQHLHQFNDDLNVDQQHLGRSPLVAPYSQPDIGLERGSSPPLNYSTRQRDSEELNGGGGGGSGLVSLKLCFSGEINGETNNYKRYCIENLTSGSSMASSRSATLTDHPAAAFSSQQADKTLTVGQLNAILSRVHVDELAKQQQQQFEASDYQNVIAGSTTEAAAAAALSSRLDQSTHYVNPIVQFESHFKNWPHLARTSAFASEQQHPQQQSTTRYNDQNAAARESGWCKYKPMPPFIVNNKPFSDIQCSLEHEYFMSTSHQSSPLGRRGGGVEAGTQASGRILLKKSTQTGELYRSERCNIQCKVDILYQVHSRRPKSSGSSTSAKLVTTSSKVYYLPLKSCLIVLGDGDKARTSSYYLVIRSLADSSLLLIFILIDILLLVESIDTKQFPLEANKRRLFSLLVALTFLPLLVAALFDFAAARMHAENQPNGQNSATRSHQNGYLINLLNDKLIPFMSDSFLQIYTYLKGESSARRRPQNNQSTYDDYNGTTTTSNEQEFERATRAKLASPLAHQELVVDNYLVPFLVYAIFMFALAINSFKLPLIGLKSPLARAASTEELGLVQRQQNARATSPKAAALSLKQQSEEQLTSQRKHKSSSLRKLTKLSGSLKNIVSSKPESQDEEVPRKLSSTSPAKSAALFAILTLFMGLQFNMSQLTQSQILLDTFNIQNDLIQQQQQQQLAYSNQQQAHHPNDRPNKTALWFVLVANFSGTIFILLLALLFSNELSVFLADFCPFKLLPTGSASSNQQSASELREQNDLKFRRFLSISLLIYALRYFVLANMSHLSRMRWFLVILFQVSELLNFPFTWFVLAARAHELLNEDANFERSLRKSALAAATNDESAQEERTSHTTLRLINIHILIQSSLAFVYFPLARFLALFVHSFHASLYFHSDNVHWFIASLYEGKYAAAASRISQPVRSTQNDTFPGSSDQATSSSDALFAPLPSERQTYLHASRSFIKFNSLVCLLVGCGFLIAFATLRYKHWKRARHYRKLELAAEQQRRQAASADRESDLIDEQLSIDLRQMHAPFGAQTRYHSRQSLMSAGREEHLTEGTSLTHLPRAERVLSQQIGDCDDCEDDERPRARIHFRYNLKPRRDSTSSSLSSIPARLQNARPRAAAAAARRQLTPSTTTTADETTTTRTTTTPDAESPGGRSPQVELRIPIIMEDDEMSGNERIENGGRGSATESCVNIEQLTQTYTKRMERVRLVGDDENWSLGSGADQTVPEPPNEFRRQATHENWSPPPPPAAFAEQVESDGDQSGDSDEQSKRDNVVPTFAHDASSSELQGRAQQVGARISLASGRAHQFDSRNNKRITFAPTTTFIDQDGGQSERQFGRQSTDDENHSKHAELRASSAVNNVVVVSQRRQPRYIASPEPSIDEDEDEHGGDSVHFHVNESIGLRHSSAESSPNSPVDNYDDSIEHRNY